jgi:hypothetical protein
MNYTLNINTAKTAYDECEQLLRKIEEIGSFCEMSEYGEIDWYIAPKTLSLLAEQRWAHLQMLKQKAINNNQCLQKLGYDFIMCNFCYENATAYYLEAFRQKFVKKNTGWNVPPFVWVKSILVEESGNRYFKYFGHTNNPLYVK